MTRRCRFSKILDRRTYYLVVLRRKRVSNQQRTSAQPESDRQKAGKARIGNSQVDGISTKRLMVAHLARVDRDCGCLTETLTTSVNCRPLKRDVVLVDVYGG